MTLLADDMTAIGTAVVRGAPCVQFAVGREAVLRLRPMLMELSARCDQAGAMDEMEYYLSRPGFAGKRPVVVLVGAGAGADRVDGAVLLYEHQLRGVGCRVFTADYHGGERTVIAPLALRPRLAFTAAAALMKRGALVVHLMYEDATAPVDTAGIECGGRRRFRWRAEERGMTGYLPILETVDETLATLGKHTRRNLRLYRRRAEADLGCVEVDRPEVTRDEFVGLNRICAYPVSDALAAWRYDATRRFPEGSLFLGLRGGNGDWLSLIGGRTHAGRTVIEWQMNRTDLPAYSLSTLMRSHLIEHEVERGIKRIYFVAGTSHPIRNSMVLDKFIDVTVLRYAVPAGLVRRFLPKDGEDEPSFLLKTLADDTRPWQRW